MRFTFPILTLCNGGAQRMLAELTNWLVQRGHQVTILMPSGGIVEYPVQANLIRLETSIIKSKDFPAADIIVSNFFTTVHIAEQASREGQGIHIRLALCYEPVFLDDNFSSFPTYSVTPNLLVLSSWQQKLIQLIHGLRGRIVPIGVSSFFYNLKIRDQLGEPLNITAIIRKSTLHFSWHREQDYLLAELNKIKQRYPHVNINFICPPGEYGASQELQQLGASGLYRIWTPANDEELRWHYNTTDIFVSSSVYDSGALPGLEAMRCGAALVAVYSGGNTDYAQNEVNCLMSYRYENRLATDIARLIEMPLLRTRLAATGEADSYKFTWDKSAAMFEKAALSIFARLS